MAISELASVVSLSCNHYYWIFKQSDTEISTGWYCRLYRFTL